jgi:hypothetical protein
MQAPARAAPGSDVIAAPVVPGRRVQGLVNVAEPVAGLKVRRGELEHRVLDGLRERLLAPELVEEFARAFQEEVNRLAAEKTLHRAEDEGRLGAVRRKIATIIRAIEDGMYQPSMKERMDELDAEKAMLEERLASAPEPPKIRLHPNLPGLYREKVAALEQALRTRRSRPRPPR